MIADNPFQRETQKLRSKRSQQILDKLYQIGKLNKNMQLQQSLECIEQLQTLLNQVQEEQNQDIANQLRFMKAILLALDGQTQRKQYYCQQISKNDDNFSSRFPARISILNLCTKIHNKQPIIDKDIQSIQQILKQQPSYHSEILFKLTGAKSVQRMKQITYEQINNLSENQSNKAIKFQIVGNWKYYINDTQNAIKMKTQSIRLWTILNNKDKAMKAQKQQKMIINLISDPIQQITTEENYLTITKNIVSYINDQTDNNEKLKKHRIQKKKNAVRVMIKKIIRDLQKEGNNRGVHQSASTKKSISGNLHSSGLKKQQKIEEKIDNTKQFLKQNQKSNYLCIDFIENSKFSVEIQRNFTQKMGIFNKIIKGKYRFFFSWLTVSKQQSKSVSKSGYHK